MVGSIQFLREFILCQDMAGSLGTLSGIMVTKSGNHRLLLTTTGAILTLGSEEEETRRASLLLPVTCGLEKGIEGGARFGWMGFLDCLTNLLEVKPRSLAAAVVAVRHNNQRIRREWMLLMQLRKLPLNLLTRDKKVGGTKKTRILLVLVDLLHWWS
jgi:hypothetical protein